MTLPTTFGPLTGQIPLSDLDANFAALGAISTIPCGVTGTNTISLTPLANTPSIPAYANYMAFSGIAAASNTGPATAGVGNLQNLQIYKDTPTGPSALTGGEIVSGNLITLTYDGSLPGFHLETGINTAAGTFLPLGGGTLTGTMQGTSIALTGDISAQDAVFTGGITGVSVAAVRVTIGGGTPVLSVISTTVASVVFSTILPGASADQTSPFSSLALGDTVMLGLPSLASVGVSFNAFASTPGTVTLRAFNVTASTVSGVTLSSVRFTAMKF